MRHLGKCTLHVGLLVGFLAPATVWAASQTRSATVLIDGGFGLAGEPWISTEDGFDTSSLLTYPDATQSRGLGLAGFGFSIPAGTKIDGIQVSAAKGGLYGPIVDTTARLLIAGAPGAADRSNPDPWPENATVVYGGTTDLWGESLSAEDVNDSSFGFLIGAEYTSFVFGRPIVYDVSITVSYPGDDPAVPAANTAAALVLITALLGAGVTRLYARPTRSS